MRITKFRSNYALLFVLIIAFLATQWTISHIHLAEYHNHDGSHHQHQIETHSHNLADQHATAIDFSHQASHGNVIEFDNEYSLPKRKKLKNISTVLVASVLKPPMLSLPISVKIPVIINIKRSHRDSSIDNPRAPPKTS